MLWHTINCDYYRLIITTHTIIVPWPQSSLHTQKIILMFYRVQRDGAMASLPEPHLKLSCPSNSLRRRVLQQGIMSLGLCLCKWTNVNSSRRRWKMMEENRMLASGLHMHAEGVQPPPTHTNACTHAHPKLNSIHHESGFSSLEAHPLFFSLLFCSQCLVGGCLVSKCSDHTRTPQS